MSEPLEETIRRFARDVSGRQGRDLVEVVLTPLAMADLVMQHGPCVLGVDERGQYLPVSTVSGTVRVRREPA